MLDPAKSALASRKAADIYLAGPLGRQEAQCDGTRIAASAMGSDVPEAIVVEVSMSL